MASNKEWPRATRSLWAGLKVLLILAIPLQLLLCAPAIYELSYGVIDGADMEESPLAILMALGGLVLSILWFIVFLLCIVYTSRLTVRMIKNLNEIGAPGDRMSPGWAVGFYFVPFANLYMPQRAVRQIWRDTFGLSNKVEPNDGVITAWWLCWILSNILSSASFRLTLESGGMDEAGPHNLGLYNISLYLDVASNFIGVLACWFMLQVFGPMARTQDEVIANRAAPAAADSPA